MRVHPDHPELLFAVDLFDGLLVSRDAGATWTQENTGIETIVPTSLVVSGDRLYIGTQACGVWSADLSVASGTFSWQPKRSNRPVPTVYSAEIQVDPNNPDVLFVSAYPGGLMRSTNGGVTWCDRNGINPSVVVDDPLRQGYYSFAIDPTDSKRDMARNLGARRLSIPRRNASQHPLLRRAKNDARRLHLPGRDRS